MNNNLVALLLINIPIILCGLYICFKPRKPAYQGKYKVIDRGGPSGFVRFCALLVALAAGAKLFLSFAVDSVSQTAGSAVPTAGTWTRVQTLAGGVSVEMPRAPNQDTIGNMRYHIIEAPGGRGFILLELPVFASGDFMPEQTFAMLAQAGETGPGATITVRSDVKTQENGVPVRKLVLDAADGRMAEIYEFSSRSEHPAVMWVGPAPERDSQDVRRFFSSMKVVLAPLP